MQWKAQIWIGGAHATIIYQVMAKELIKLPYYCEVVLYNTRSYPLSQWLTTIPRTCQNKPTQNAIKLSLMSVKNFLTSVT